MEKDRICLLSCPGQCPGHHLLWNTHSFSFTELPGCMAMEQGSVPASANFEECKEWAFPWPGECGGNTAVTFAVRPCATGKTSNSRVIVWYVKKRKETTLPEQIHSWEYLTSKYCLSSILVFPWSPPSMLFPIPWESAARKVSVHSVLSLPCEPAILQGQGGGRVACLYCSKIYHPLLPLPYIKTCCHSALYDRSCFWNPCFREPLKSKGKRARQKPFGVTSWRWTACRENGAFKVVSKQHDFILPFPYFGVWSWRVVSFTLLHAFLAL